MRNLFMYLAIGLFVLSELATLVLVLVYWGPFGLLLLLLGPLAPVIVTFVTGMSGPAFYLALALCCWGIMAKLERRARKGV